MPQAAKPWEEYAPKPESGPWEAYQRPQGPKPPKSWTEQVRESGPAGEVVGQLGRLAKGAAGTAGAALALTPPGMAIRGTKKTQETIKGLGEVVAAPVRELGGLPQPGETGFQALPFAERPFAAIGTMLGADPARVRQLESQGRTGEAWAARLTVPLVTLGLAKVLRSLKVERSAAVRGAKLAVATGKIPAPGPDVVPLYGQVLPELNKTAKMPPRARPPNLPQNQPWTTGTKPTDLPEHVGLINATLDRLEQEFNLELQKSARQSTMATSVADAIRAEIGKLPAAGQSAEADVMRKVLSDRAVEFDKPWTYRDLNLERGRLYKLPKGAAAERQAARTNADLLADKATEDALRDIVYGKVESTSGRPDYFRRMKQTEWALQHLKDRLDAAQTDLAFATAEDIAREIGTVRKWVEKKATVYFHPTTGKMAAIVHPFRGRIASPEFTTRMIKEAYEPARAVSRTKTAGAAALMGRVPSREPIEEE